MKVPSQIRTYCPHCRRHTVHEVKVVKPSTKKSGLSKGKRRMLRNTVGKGNHGRYSRRPITQWKRVGVKGGSKRIDLRLVCTECGKATIKSLPRTRKFELVTVKA